MTDSPWSKPDESDLPDPTDAVLDGTAGSSLPAGDRRPLGPPSSSLPNVPDITPVAGTPIPPGAVPEGTAVMPVVPAALPTPHPTVAQPATARPVTATPGGGAAAGQPQYVVADRVPWYRTPNGRTRAGIGIGLAVLVGVAGIVWLTSRGSGDDGVLVTNGSTTTLPGQFGAGLDTTTTDLLAVAPASTTTIPASSTTVAATTTAPVATTTTTLPATTTTTSTTTTTTSTTTTSTTTTSTTSTTTTTTLPSLPQVVVPSATSTIGEIIQASPGLSDLDVLMSSVGFFAELNALGDPYTLLAPSNDALAALGVKLPSDAEALRVLLRRHVATDGRLGSRQLFEQTELTMLDGSTLTVDAAEMSVGGVSIVVADKGGADTDQILHVVDAVLAG